MSYFKFKESDIIRSKYTAYPSFSFDIAVASNEGRSTQKIYILPSSSVGIQRHFQNIHGVFVTGSYNVSASVYFGRAGSVSTTYKHGLNLLRNIYASSSFLKPQNYASSSIFSQAAASQTIAYVNIPSVVYGTEIKPGTVSLSSSHNYRYNDDGYGGLYSGSVLVGSVFYQHGVIEIDESVAPLGSIAFMSASFSGTHKIPCNMYLCQVPRGALNFSTNSSYTVFSSGSTRTEEITTAQPKTFITTIGLYDANYRLVGVAKVSSPILNEEKTGLLFRLKMNF